MPLANLTDPETVADIEHTYGGSVEMYVVDQCFRCLNCERVFDDGADVDWAIAAVDGVSVCHDCVSDYLSDLIDNDEVARDARLGKAQSI